MGRKTRQAQRTLWERKIWPDPVFGEIKGARGFTRARSRGQSSVHTQALLAAHNILKMVKWAKKFKGKPSDPVIDHGWSEMRLLLFRYFNFSFHPNPKLSFFGNRLISQT